MSPYLKIVRLPNLAIIVLTQYLLWICVIGKYYSFGDASPAMGNFDFLLLVVSTLLIAAGGYIVNDIFDARADEINKPEKMIIGKSIDPSLAYKIYYALTFAGILIGFYLAFRVDYLMMGFVYIAIALLLYLYSDRYQKMVLWGNIVISVLSAMVIIIVWLFEFFALRNNPLIYAEVLKQLPAISILTAGYAAFAFLVSLIREIFKDMQDVEGDKAAGYYSLPVAKGIKTAKWIAIGLIFLSIGAMAFAQYWLFINGLMLVFWYITVAVQILLLFLLYNAFKANGKEDYHFLSNASKIIMVAGVLSMQLFYISF